MLGYLVKPLTQRQCKTHEFAKLTTNQAPEFEDSDFDEEYGFEREVFVCLAPGGLE